MSDRHTLVFYTLVSYLCTPNFTGYTHGYSLKVERRSPKPLVWVRVLVPVQVDIHNNKEMNKVTDFLKASWDEVQHSVTWPTFTSLQSSTTLVLVGSLIFAFVVGIMDYAFENALNLLYSSF